MKRTPDILIRIKALILSIFLIFGSSINHAMADQSTFDDFSGKEGLTRIMDDFMVGLVADPRTGPFFKDSNQARVKAMLVLQFCELLDGGCQYPGLNMVDAHKNMKVNRAAFNGLVEQLQFAMDKHEIAFSSQNKLLAKLAPMYRDIETTKGDAVPPNSE